MPYTTQGFMTAADIAEVRADMDLDLCGCCEAGPVTLAELARELDAQPYKVAAFGDLGNVRDTDELDTEDAHAIREAWASDTETELFDPENVGRILGGVCGPPASA